MLYTATMFWQLEVSSTYCSLDPRCLVVVTEASDPLAATLENVPYVPAMANIPAAALIDLVAFTNGQTGLNNPQRQGLNSAIKDGASPLNIVDNTPTSPAYRSAPDQLFLTFSNKLTPLRTLQ